MTEQGETRLAPEQYGSSIHWPYCRDGRCTGCIPASEVPYVEEGSADWFGCNRKGCGRPQSEHEFGVFCP